MSDFVPLEKSIHFTSQTAEESETNKDSTRRKGSSSSNQCTQNDQFYYSGKSDLPEERTTRASFERDFLVQEFSRKLWSSVRDFVGIKLRRTLHDQMINHFFGITETMFWTNFKKSQRYLPSLQTLGYPDHSSMILRLPDIFFYWPNYHDKFTTREYPPSCKYDRRVMILPAYLDGSVCDQHHFLARIWHLSLVILTLHDNFISLQTLNSELKNIYGVEFNCRMWGFGSAIFYEFLLCRWPKPGVKLVQIKLKESTYPCLVREEIQGQSCTPRSAPLAAIGPREIPLTLSRDNRGNQYTPPKSAPISDFSETRRPSRQKSSNWLSDLSAWGL